MGVAIATAPTTLPNLTVTGRVSAQGYDHSANPGLHAVAGNSQQLINDKDNHATVTINAQGFGPAVTLQGTGDNRGVLTLSPQVIDCPVIIATGTSGQTANILSAAVAGVGVVSGIGPGGQLIVGNGAAAGPSLWGGSGAPAAGLGANGDYYYRSDTPGTALQRVYVKSAGAWVGVV